MHRSRLYISRSRSLDWLTALEFGRVDDGQPDELWVRVSDQVRLLRDAVDGRVVGFQIFDESNYDPDAHQSLWAGPRFDAPLVGLTDATPNEIVIAVRALLGDAETHNRELFESAAGAQGEEALELWLRCLAAGDSMAHFAVGYTLFELGREREAYRHLRHYCEISPAGSWNWRWLGVAAQAAGEVAEARDAYRRAVALDDETDADELLDALDAAEPEGLLSSTLAELGADHVWVEPGRRAVIDLPGRPVLVEIDEDDELLCTAELCRGGADADATARSLVAQGDAFVVCETRRSLSVTMWTEDIEGCDIATLRRELLGLAARAAQLGDALLANDDGWFPAPPAAIAAMEG